MEGKGILWSDTYLCGSKVAVLLMDKGHSFYLFLKLFTTFTRCCFTTEFLPHVAGYTLKDSERIEYFLISRWKLPLSIPASIDAWVTFPLCLVSMLVI